MIFTGTWSRETVGRVHPRFIRGQKSGNEYPVTAFPEST